MPAIRNAAAVLATAAALIAPASAQACAYENGNPNEITLQQAKRATLCLLNKERTSRGIEGEASRAAPPKKGAPEPRHPQAARQQSPQPGVAASRERHVAAQLLR